MSDSIKTKSFKSRGREQWIYEIETKAGKRYDVVYTVTQYGHAREMLYSNGELIWDREFKIGDSINQTVDQFICKSLVV